MTVFTFEVVFTLLHFCTALQRPTVGPRYHHKPATRSFALFRWPQDGDNRWSMGPLYSMESLDAASHFFVQEYSCNLRLDDAIDLAGLPYREPRPRCASHVLLCNMAFKPPVAHVSIPSHSRAPAVGFGISVRFSRLGVCSRMFCDRGSGLRVRHARQAGGDTVCNICGSIANRSD